MIVCSFVDWNIFSDTFDILDLIKFYDLCKEIIRCRGRVFWDGK